MILIQDYPPPLLKLNASPRSIRDWLRLYFSGIQTVDLVVSGVYHGPRVTQQGILYHRRSLVLGVYPILLVGVITVEGVLKIRLQFGE